MTTDKVKHGKLIQVLPSGNTVNLVENKPWAELQKARKRFIQRGYNANTLKITYLNNHKEYAVQSNKQS